MALTFPKRSFTGAGVAGTLDAPGITSIYTVGDTFKSSTTLTGWDDVTGGIWAGSVVVAFGVGTAGEEKILCNFTQSTSTFTIVSRGYDGTSSAATSTWSTGSLFTIAFTATEAAELNAVTQSMKTILTSAGTTTTPQPITVGSSAGSIGTGTKPSAIDHDHKITASTLNGWLTASASGQLPAAVAVYLSSLNSGALPTAVSTSQVWTQFGGTTSGGVTQNSITGFTKYIVVAFSRVTTTNSGAAAQIQISITANGTANINPVIMTVPSLSNTSLTTFAYVSTTAGTTFSAQNVPNYGSTGGVSSALHNLIVIGLN
jgi:hypothetical protein